MIAGSTVYHLLSDQVGSVRLVVTTSGSVAKRIDYDAWGRIKNQTGSLVQPFGFAGGLWDPEAQLVQMGARWYDPVVGRFITKDPIRFGGGFNLYAYAGNDPVNFYDPNGEDVQSFAKCMLSIWSWEVCWFLEKNGPPKPETPASGSGGPYREKLPPPGPEFLECAGKGFSMTSLCCRIECQYTGMPNPTACPDPGSPEECYWRCMGENGF